MSLMNIETYDALKAAGAPELEARQAAIEMATMGGLLTIMAERLNGLESKMTWIMGIGFTVMLAGFSAVFALLWQIFLRLPR
jgi:hypothetical protein